LNDRITRYFGIEVLCLIGYTRMATFFATAADFAAWLEQHGATKSEFVVGYYKRGSKRLSMTWAESVDAALCYG